MVIGTLVGVGVGLAILIFGAVFVYRRWKYGAIEWFPLGSRAEPQVSVNANSPTDVSLVRACFEAARQELFVSGLWTSANIHLALADVQIYVMLAPSWRDGWGRNVAGLQVDRIIYVGNDLLALGHELIHKLDALVSGDADANHERWKGARRELEARYESRARALLAQP